MATDHCAVDRDALAWPDPNEVSERDVADRYFNLLIAPYDPRGIRLKIQQALDRLRATRLDDQRQPLREDVIGADHDRNREKGPGGIRR